MILLYVENKGADQTVKMRSLVSTCIIHCMESILSTILVIYKIDILASLCN